jgi:pheromone shutdown protein TraB
LEHQLIAIDFTNDIAKRSNWIHTDINFEDFKDRKDFSDTIKRILTTPTKKVINESQKEMQLVMYALYQSVEYGKILDYSQRRIIFANDLIDSMTSLYQTLEKISPELLLNMRNEMIEDTILDLIKENNEIMILYGAAHMINIEKFVLDTGFTFKAEQCFDVFNVNGL